MTSENGQNDPPKEQADDMSIIIVIVIAVGVLGTMLIGFIKPKPNVDQ